MNELPDVLFVPLADHIAARTGLRVPAAQRWLLVSRLQARIAARDLRENIDSYVTLLLRDERELDELVETLRVGETFFYRHPRQLQAIRRVALPEIVANCEAEGRSIRIWSAGCATGEEPYSLAMLVRAAHPDLGVEILATDLSDDALERARAGVFESERLNNVPPAIREWGLEQDGHRYRVCDSVREMVRFEQRNLLGDPYPREQDLVLCRNVLIYFGPDTKQRVLDGIFGAVRMHGWVALGYADRVGPTRGLETLRTDEGVLYRRVGVASVAPPPPHAEPEPPARATRIVATEQQARLAGELTGSRGRRHAHTVLASLLSSGSDVLDLTELRFADEGVARELSRVASAMRDDGRALVLEVASAGIERFLRRHGIVPPARVRRTSEAPC